MLLKSQFWIHLIHWRKPLFPRFLQEQCKFSEKFSVVRGKCSVKQSASKWMLSIINHFIAACMQSDVNLIRSPWRYAGRGITWSYFSVWHWLLRKDFGNKPAKFIIWFPFFTESMFQISRCSIKKQLIYWSLLVLLDHLKECIYSPQNMQPNLLVKLTALACTDWNGYQPHHMFTHRYGLSPESF